MIMKNVLFFIKKKKYFCGIKVKRKKIKYALTPFVLLWIEQIPWDSFRVDTNNMQFLLLPSHTDDIFWFDDFQIFQLRIRVQFSDKLLLFFTSAGKFLIWLFFSNRSLVKHNYFFQCQRNALFFFCFRSSKFNNIFMCTAEYNSQIFGRLSTIN